ncbi:MAG: class I SAM-dependent DNA methyltransferase [Halanaerobiaceae bacterium]
MEKIAYSRSFATIYDDVMSAVPYDFWYKYINEILDYYNKDVKNVLDLACGTGNMCIRFARDNKNIVGLDGSREMLQVAAEKIEDKDLQVNFIHSDLRTFELEQNFDLAFSVFDSLNYILSLSDLKKAFKNVYQVLKEDGIFIFDLNTLKRLMSIEPGTTLLTGENYTCFWRDIIDREKKRWQVKLRIYFEDENDNYYEEFHQETSYPLDEVQKILTDIGFKYVKKYKAYTFMKGDEDANRVYFVALKSNNQLKEKSCIKKIKRHIKWRISRYF